MVKIYLSWKRDSIFKMVYLHEFYQIWVDEVSKSKSTNRYLESKIFQTIEQNAIVWFFVKQEYFFWDTL